MHGWRRIPFTCSYLPGKGFVPHMFVKGVGAYLLFTSVTNALLQQAAASAAATFVAAAVFATLAAALAGRRLRHAHAEPLILEDEPPTDIIPLRLGDN